MFVEYWVVDAEMARSGLERSGANVSLYDANCVVETQVAQIEDVIQMGNVDGILALPIDTWALEPVFERAGQVGIPPFPIGLDVYVDASVSCTYTDQYLLGVAAAEAMEELAKEQDKYLYIAEGWCPMTMGCCVDRAKGFSDSVEASPHMEIVATVDTYGMPEVLLDFLMDTLPAHPEINAVHQSGGTDAGYVEAMKALGRYYPAGHPDHVICVSQDAAPQVYEPLSDGYYDFVIEGSPWVEADGAAKAALLYVCQGKVVPSRVYSIVETLTAETIKKDLYWDGPRWGEMLMKELNFDLWPILDLTAIGLPTPTLE